MRVKITNITCVNSDSLLEVYINISKQMYTIFLICKLLHILVLIGTKTCTKQCSIYISLIINNLYNYFSISVSSICIWEKKMKIMFINNVLMEVKRYRSIAIVDGWIQPKIKIKLFDLPYKSRRRVTLIQCSTNFFSFF
jgi:hypothetical protein